MDLDDLKDSLEDLLSLEVNTVIKANMTAAKRPNTAGMLVDIVNEYEARLTKLDPDRARIPGDLADVDLARVDRARFQRVSRWADALAADARENVKESLLFARIRDNSARIERIFEESPAAAFDVDRRDETGEAAFKLNPARKMMLRKIWEIGTEEVVMQTVIYLDGDVITRIQPSCYQDPAMKPVVDMHNQGVKTSIEFWGKLVDLVQTFVATMMGAVGSTVGAKPKQSAGGGDASDVN